MQLVGVTVAQLEYLVAATSQPRWSDAASSLAVSPSALSQGIAEIERKLGVTLFSRDGRRRVATSDGIAAAKHAERILNEVGELTRWAEQTRSGSTGTITIGMIDTAAMHHFGDVLRRFGVDRPDVRVQLLVHPSNQLLSMLLNGTCDVVVAVEPDPDPRLRLDPLLVETLHVYAPPGQPVGPPERWGPWVGFPSGSRTRAVIARELRRSGASYDVVTESSQPAVLREMVRLAMGWAVLAAIDAEREPNALKRALDTPIAERTLTLVSRHDRVASPALMALTNALKDHASTG